MPDRTQFLGIDNVLALRGDPIKSESHFIPERDGHPHAEHLIHQITALNQGKYLYDEEQEAAPTNLCIGAACYPEKHAEALNLATDIAYLKRKVDAGADYLVTQMFFDNARYFDFVDRWEGSPFGHSRVEALTNFRHVSFIPKIFKIDLPDTMPNGAYHGRRENVKIEWTTQQAKTEARNVPSLHFYTMGRSRPYGRSPERLDKAVWFCPMSYVQCLRT